MEFSYRACDENCLPVGRDNWTDRGDVDADGWLPADSFEAAEAEAMGYHYGIVIRRTSPDDGVHVYNAGGGWADTPEAAAEMVRV